MPASTGRLRQERIDIGKIDCEVVGDVAKGKYQKWLTPDGLTLLKAWARDGLTDKQIAHNMGITPSTLYAWKDKYPEISESLKKGKEVVDIEVENALLKRAKGYAYLEQKTEIDPLGKKTITKTVKQVAPDVGAAVFWLKNRRPDRWRDRVDPTAPMNPERQDDGFLAALDQKAVEVWDQSAEAEGDADEDKE